MTGESTPLQQRLRRLEAHLAQENPVLLEVVKSFRALDHVAYRLKILGRDESFATRVPWWPLVSILGTFSSGKSTFVNGYLGVALQQSGNQAVDDKFTVICFGGDGESRVLPGLALDADPRFPFYQISQDIEEVAAGEGRRVDAYLQLKTCNSEPLRGKILIDSPGFDADEQRTSTLRITDHIIDLSDLVLVFFDARHPEPGAMLDTLEHLVGNTIDRPDSNKFLYILNQIDNTAREDNPEEVFAAWQRALAQKGLTAGRFYRIYDKAAALPIEDEARRLRFESKRDAELAEIYSRIQQVEVERAYRIIGVLEKLAKSIEQEVVPAIRAAKAGWKRRVLWYDGIVFGLVAIASLAYSVRAGYWDGLAFSAPWSETVSGLVGWLLLAIAAGAIGYVHFALRKLAARLTVRRLRRVHRDDGFRDWVIRAFVANVRPWRPVAARPAGWGPRARRRIATILGNADRYVQSLNDKFADPSGMGEAREGAGAPAPLDTPPATPSATPPATPPGTRVDPPPPAEPPSEAAGGAEVERVVAGP